MQVRNLDEGRTLTTALSEADPQLLSLTEAAPVGIPVTDPAGQIVYRNPAARALLGPELQSFGDADWLSLARAGAPRASSPDAFRAGLRGETPTAVDRRVRRGATRGGSACGWSRSSTRPATGPRG